jgi:ubiquinone/menaquinone biosynthesis C-methylase UbiE
MHIEENFPPVFADPVFEDRFTKDGYVVMPFFDAAEVATCRKLYFTTMTEPPADFFTTAFLPDGETRRKVKDGLERLIVPHAEALMPTYSTCVGHFIVKRGRPDAGFLDLHQDFNFVDHSLHRAVHAWIALADVDQQNGCLTVLPGSHKLAHHISAMGVNATPYDSCRPLLNDCKVGIPMKAGEALFFDERTLHGSYPNKSPDVRIAMGAVFLPKGVKQRLYVTDDAKSSVLDVLEVESETLLNYSTVLRPPYPKGFKKIGTFDYTAQMLSPEVAQSLRRLAEKANPTRPAEPAQVQAALLDRKPGFFSRLFGRSHASRCESGSAMGLTELSNMDTMEIEKDTPIRDAREPLAAHAPEDVKRYYNERTGAYLEGFGEVFQGSRPASTTDLLNYIIEASELKDGIKILDAGCGVCGPAIFFAQSRNLTVEALNISAVQVAEALKRVQAQGLDKQITVREGDFHSLATTYNVGSFDRILFLETICHARDYRTVLEQAMTVLKPGGLLYIKDFYCQDFRSKPELIETQLEDLRALNRCYCLALPDLPSLLDLVSELGFMLEYLRKPGYDAVFEPWINFDRIAGQAWTPKLPYFELIAAVELRCRKPVPHGLPEALHHR